VLDPPSFHFTLLADNTILGCPSHSFEHNNALCQNLSGVSKPTFQIIYQLPPNIQFCSYVLVAYILKHKCLPLVHEGKMMVIEHQDALGLGVQMNLWHQASALASALELSFLLKYKL